MNQKLVDSVVTSVLYEGHVLYPYRAATQKSIRRFAFGRVFPESYSVADNGSEPCSMETQCLIEAGPLAHVNVTIRFLHAMTRDIGALAAPLRKMPAADNPDFFHVVPELRIDGRRFVGGIEMVERPFPMPTMALTEICDEPISLLFSFPIYRAVDPILDKRQQIAGVMVRRQEEVEGVVDLRAERLDDNVFRVSVKLINQTSVPQQALDDPDELVLRTFASTHVLFHSAHGRFLSLIDPPEAYAKASAACRNIGTWPVLIGDAKKRERDTMLSSPIILSDYPEVEPSEVPFDSTTSRIGSRNRNDDAATLGAV